jgi:integrase
MGWTFQPTYTDKKTGEKRTVKDWWIGYHHNGKLIRENSRSTKEADAKRLLKRRITEIGIGKFVGPDADKLMFADLAQMLLDDYKVNGQVIHPLEAVLKRLHSEFGNYRAVNITTDRVNAYKAKQLDNGYATATVALDLRALKRAFNLAVEAGRLATRPVIKVPEVDNARTGFLDHAEFTRLCAALPSDLQDPASFLYLSGWRVGEMRSLEWQDVDLNGHVIRLRAENSKNGQGRTLPLVGELLAIIERAEARRLLHSPFVFHRDSGRPVALFRKSWATACTKAGLGKVHVHDLRRCTARNLLRSGISEPVAMRLTGHKTPSIFRRYAITTESDLAEAAQKLQAHLDEQPTTTPPKVTQLRRHA